MKDQKGALLAVRTVFVSGALFVLIAHQLSAQFASCTTAPAGSQCLSSGNVGIGTMSPAYSLDVGTGTQNTSTPSGTVALGAHGSAIFGTGDATTLIDSLSNSGALYFNSGNGHPSFSVTRSSNITNNDYTIYSLRNLVFAPGPLWHSIFSVGNVGIGGAFSAGNGTSPTPPSALSVTGGIAIGSYATSTTNAGTGNLDVSGSIGVGTQAPGYKIDVQGGQINASGGLCIAGSCQSSWPGSNVVTYSGNNLGIGTTTPQAPLDAVGNVNSAQVGRFESTAGSNNAIVTIQNDTNLTGVHNLDFRGSANTWAWFRNEGLNWESATNVGLHLLGNPLNTNSPAVLMGTISAQNTSSGDVQMISMAGTYAPASGTGTWEALSLTPTVNQTGGSNGNTYGLVINPTLTSAPNWTSLEVTNGKSVFLGSVGIGTSFPCVNSAPANCQLSVNGAIQAKEVVVNSDWSDYVFAPDYELQPLSQTAAYIEQNHHLPNIPSAAEVAAKGISLGDMQSKLLAKIEELTLQMIRLDSRNQELVRQIEELRKGSGK